MEYRRLGRAGLKVSALSLGAWVTYGGQVGVAEAVEILAVARDHGINFLDNAESYAQGKAENVMGEALRELRWARENFVVTTKFFAGLNDGPNQRRTLNRKYLLGAIDGSLARLGLDYVDVVYAHRPDPDTPIEETVWAFHDIIARGKALYWGTSEWDADAIRAAWDFADRAHLHKPVTEQPQYNLLARRRVEQEYARLYPDIGLGLTTWSPLAGGVLSGKYADGIAPDSRAALNSNERLLERIASAGIRAAVEQLADIARTLDATPAQLALSWALRNPHVSTVITGASRVEQLRANLGALALVPQLDNEIAQRLEGLFAGLEA
ncbi:aldo/keto reductase [Cupriavidus sp. AcVe19-6a]|uniref:aldo/keto reductase n=1 Tax=Cupriavidus sp. AcVe19-6a TaxID=2821358 RepID=UPI001AE14C97|nr:aldo/keto reductase [Cupriavidus sp. AcVe19-6a]MBP0635912.1 aldo/keto reductase [Cupriavidus sp. AcVe19-6a]